MACAGLHALPRSRVVRMTIELHVFLGSAARGVIRGLYSQIVNFRIVYVHMRAQQPGAEAAARLFSVRFAYSQYNILEIS